MWLDMTTKRSYGDPCGIARALDSVGERWALLVVRELLLGPKRFTDLRAGLPSLSADVLSQRLRGLEQAGVVQRITLPPPVSVKVYDLTDRGRELEPIVLALGRWGSRAPFPPAAGELGIDAFVLALKTLFDPERAGGLSARYALRISDHPFTAIIDDGALEITRGGGGPVDATIASDPETLTSVLWHERAIDCAVATGRLELRGDPDLTDAFLTLFPAPVPAGVADAGIG
jgi:DNA-binding HxlR family transcriptional regulator